MAVGKKVCDRIVLETKRYQAILADAKSRDISESDTVVIIGDMLADLFGYRKYSEITTEFAIRNSFVDLAVKVDGEVRFLIEAKAIGVALKDGHVRQAIDYGANHGIEWVILTNGVIWQIYKIHFRQPIDKTLVFEIDLQAVSPKDGKLLECFGALSREGFTKPAMSSLFQQQQALSRFSLAAVLLSPPLVGELRRELRRIFPGLRAEEDDLRVALVGEVLKREVVDSDEAKHAVDTLRKIAKSAERAKKKDAPAPEKMVESPGGSLMDVPAAPADSA